MTLTETSVLHAPALTFIEGDGITLCIDGDAPNWIATDERGVRILRRVDGRTPLREIVSAHGASSALPLARAWLDVTAFLGACRRHDLVSEAPYSHPAYAGRASHLELSSLEELWVHTNNSCNLTCTHCLVSSGPDGDRGLPTEAILRLLDEARDLGVSRYYFTGGEPFLRPDIKTLLAHVTEKLGADLIVLTNATFFRNGNGRTRSLEGIPTGRLKLQVSLDGATAAANDAIRGAGTFEQIRAGLRRLAKLGFETSLTAAVTRSNIAGLEGIVDLAAEAGTRSVHLMWLHRRGRILESDPARATDSFPSTAELCALLRRTRERAEACGARLDNWESAKLRVDGMPGVKHDLGNAAWTSLCVYADGEVYPSAALAGHAPVRCGSALVKGLAPIWRGSDVLRRMRAATLAHITTCAADPLRFLHGGGDMEHAYLAHEAEASHPTFRGSDPYLDLHRQAMKDAMLWLASEGRRAFNRASGYSAPIVFHAMGQAGASCAIEAVETTEVALLHGSCVLAFDVERARRIVREFYGDAADTPKPGLCCPVKPEAEDLRHIPSEVVERFYGCGSPVADARPLPGETVVDFGCGAGIDVFVAARRVGAEGRAIGLDMTGKMLSVARGAEAEVARRLGYANVAFHEGLLEAAPLPDSLAHVVTSNCVVNLSPEKRRVFAEMWRVLADHGRLVLSDIVAERPVPPRLRENPRLLGECIGGALAEEELLSEIERAGFYGVEVIRRAFWREVEGERFLSVTVRGYKYGKKAGCVFIGQTATYKGPLKAVVDEEGHLFPRGESVEVCTDTAAKLVHPPYAGSFLIAEPTGEVRAPQAGADRTDASTCGPGCC